LSVSHDDDYSRARPPGTRPVPLLPAQMKPVNITMKKGVVVGVSVQTLFA
jgi:hypothetical protein